MYPAAFANVIAVAATDNNDPKASFSTFGAKWVDVAAPGVSVYSTFPHHAFALQTTYNRSVDYDIGSGTSMASPIVAAIAALTWSAHPDYTNADVRSKVESSADKIAGTREVARQRCAHAVVRLEEWGASRVPRRVAPPGRRRGTALRSRWPRRWQVGRSRTRRSRASGPAIRGRRPHAVVRQPLRVGLALVVQDVMVGADHERGRQARERLGPQRRDLRFPAITKSGTLWCAVRGAEGGADPVDDGAADVTGPTRVHPEMMVRRAAGMLRCTGGRRARRPRGCRCR